VKELGIKVLSRGMISTIGREAIYTGALLGVTPEI
jgi:hypothetical protein